MRRLTHAAAALALAGAVIVPAAAPARAAAVFIELNPSTVPAGDELGLRASCEDNLRAATVTSGAFTGKVAVKPRYGFLTAAVTVPARTRPDNYRVRLTCADGESATATLHVVAADRPARGPATGFGGGADDGALPTVLVTGGLAAMAGGGLLGVLTLRRRRAG
jgi:hypothetical protein